MRTGRDRKARRYERLAWSATFRYFDMKYIESLKLYFPVPGALGDRNGGSVVKFTSMMNRPEDSL